MKLSCTPISLARTFQEGAIDVEGFIKLCADEGDVPLYQVMAALDAAGYEGYCSLEYEARFKTPELEGVPKSFAFLRQVRELLAILR